jgi:hypothetical protein
MDHDVRRELPVRPPRLLARRRDRVIDRIAGTNAASTPSDTQSVSRPPAVITPLSTITRDHAGYQAEHHGTTHP